MQLTISSLQWMGNNLPTKRDTVLILLSFSGRLLQGWDAFLSEDLLIILIKHAHLTLQITILEKVNGS